MQISTITKYIEDLVNTPSPTGFTKLAEKYLIEEFQKLGYKPYQTNKGNVVVPVVEEIKMAFFFQPTSIP